MMIINPFFKVMPSIPASTRILMPFTTTSGLTDVAGGHSITITGTPSISTGRSKFGQGSLLVTSGSYLRIDSTPTLDVSANKAFTLSFGCTAQRLVGCYLCEIRPTMPQWS